MKFCINCGSQLTDEALFCSACGTKQETPEVAPYDSTKTATAPSVSEEICVDEREAPRADVAPESVAKAKRKLPVFSIIRNSVILLVAFVLLIGSFMPISRISAEDYNLFSVDETENVDFGVTTIQQVILIFDSFKELEDDEIMDSKIYEKIEDLTDDLEDLDEDDLDDLSSSDRKKFDKLFFNMLRLMMQSEDVSAQNCLVVSAAFGILYIAFAIAFFVVALLNLLSILGITNGNREGLHKKSLVLLTLAPAMLLITYYANYMFTTGKLSAISIWTIVLSALAIALTTALRYIFKKKDETSVIVTRGIAIGLAIIVFCLAFAPVISVGFKTELETGKVSKIELSHNAPFFTEFDLPELSLDEVDDLRDTSKQYKKNYFENLFSSFERFSKKEATGGTGEAINATILVTLLGSKSEDLMLDAMSLGYIPFIIMAIGALIILWQNLYFLATGKYSKKLIVTGKIISAAFAIVALAFVVVFVIIITPYIDDYLIKSYDLGISAGVVFMAIFALGSLFCPSRTTPREKKEKIVTDKGPVEIPEQF